LNAKFNSSRLSSCSQLVSGSDQNHVVLDDILRTQFLFQAACGQLVTALLSLAINAGEEIPVAVLVKHKTGLRAGLQRLRRIGSNEHVLASAIDGQNRLPVAAALNDAPAGGHRLAVGDKLKGNIGLEQRPGLRTY